MYSEANGRIAEVKKDEVIMKVVTLLDETLRFISLQTKKCHVQHTARMEPYCTLTLCGMAIPDDATVRPKRMIASDSICGRCSRVLSAYYTGEHGRMEKARIGEVEISNLGNEEEYWIVDHPLLHDDGVMPSGNEVTPQEVYEAVQHCEGASSQEWDDVPEAQRQLYTEVAVHINSKG